MADEEKQIKKRTTPKEDIRELRGEIGKLQTKNQSQDKKIDDAQLASKDSKKIAKSSERLSKQNEKKIEKVQDIAKEARKIAKESEKGVKGNSGKLKKFVERNKKTIDKVSSTANEAKKLAKSANKKIEKRDERNKELNSKVKKLQKLKFPKQESKGSGSRKERTQSMWSAFEKGGLIGVYKNYKKKKGLESSGSRQDDDFDLDEREPTARRKKDTEHTNWDAFSHGGLLGLYKNIKSKKSQNQGVTPTQDNKPEESSTETTDQKPTATPIKSQTSQMVPSPEMEEGGILSELEKIYSFLDKNREQDTLSREQEKSRVQDETDAKEKRHKELLDALSKLTGVKPIGTATKEEESEGGGGLLGMASSMLGAKTASKAARGLSKTAGKTASKVSKILEGAKGLLKFIQKIPGLSMIAAGASLIMDISNAIEQHEAGQIGDQELKKTVVEAVGGALGGVGGAEIGAMLGGSLGSIVPGFGTVIGGLLGGTLGFFGGEAVGKSLAGKAFDFFTGGKDVEPPANPAQEAEALKSSAEKKDKPTTPPPAAAPTASPQPKTTGGGGESTPGPAPVGGGDTGGAPPSPAPASSGSAGLPTASPAPVATPDAPASSAGGSTSTPAPSAAPSPGGKSVSLGSQLGSTTTSNQDARMSAAADKSKPIVVGGGKQSSSEQQDQGSKTLPSVRNNETTFDRLVFYSTRVV